MRVLLIAASLAASMATLAQAPAQPAGFAALDRNGDGYLTRIEAAADAEIAKRFAQFDIDKDRRLSRDEYLAAREDNDKRAALDAALTARVREALLSASGISAKAIAVETYEGGVQLSGFVPLPDMASRAGRLVAAVSGVRTVNNNLVARQR